MYDADEQLAVQKRVAELLEKSLGEQEQAISAYRRALEVQADDKDVLLALERLHLARKEYPDLLDVLERRAELSESDEERKALAYRRAEQPWQPAWVRWTGPSRPTSPSWIRVSKHRLSRRWKRCISRPSATTIWLV